MKKLSANGKKAIAIASMIVFIALSAAVFWYVGKPMLRFVSEPNKFRDWVDGHGCWGRLAFIGMMALQVFVAIIPGEPLEIVSGYAFGAVEGTVLCIIGALVGSLSVFLFVRTFGTRAVEVFFPREKIRSLRFLKNKKRLNMWVFIIFFIPGTPKDLISYFVGLTDMKISSWVLITSVARLPSVVTSTVGGNALGMQNYQFALIIFAATILISAAGLIIYNRICRYNRMCRSGRVRGRLTSGEAVKKG